MVDPERPFPIYKVAEDFCYIETNRGDSHFPMYPPFNSPLQPFLKQKKIEPRVWFIEYMNVEFKVKIFQFLDDAWLDMLRDFYKRHASSLG